MSYELETTRQIYGNQNFLSHIIKGQTAADDRHLFAQRVPSYGIFSFGAMGSRQTKSVVLADENIISPISLCSIYAFNPSASSDEIRFRLYAGTTELAELRLTSNDMPYQFPAGAIIDPSLTIEVEPRYSVSQLMIYWQPVHILKYSAIT